MDHNHHHHPAGEQDDAALAELLDLDAEVLHAYLSEVTGLVHDLAAGRPVRRILDLGCGTGNGALALARRFPDADVIAVDQSAGFLARLRDKARDLGLDGRVHTVEANLDESWPAFGPVDVAWSSMALHHLADPDRALKQILGLLSPDGLLAVAEMPEHLRFLPDDLGLGRPGLEARCRAALHERASAVMPYLGADWGQLMTRAGFAGVAERAFEIDLTPPLPAAAGRYVQANLRLFQSHVAESMAADDLAVLDTLTGDDGPASALHRQDLAIRGTKILWTASRP
ncbi:MAG: class I SAM-dependent methyltransferase [Streptosporangiaceae bacterium]